MDVYFSTGKLQKLCNSQKQMQKELGEQLAKRLQQRLAEFKAAETLGDISHLPPARLHELGQDRKGQLAVDLVHPKRLIFKPNHDPPPVKEDGGLDRSQVTDVLIVDIGDYH